MMLLESLRHFPDSLDALVLSACVQMPSLEAIAAAEARLNIPVITALTATTSELLETLGQTPRIEGAGRLLSVGSYGECRDLQLLRRSA